MRPSGALVDQATVEYTMTDDVGDMASERVHALVVNPGVRFAIDDRRTGLQVVPGIAAPVQVESKEVSLGVLAYLSFEHPAF